MFHDQDSEPSIGSLATVSRAQPSSTSHRQVFLTALDDEVLNIIISYLVPFQELIQLASTCHELRSSVYNSRAWHSVPIDLCLVERCFGCGRIRRSLAGALTICQRSPVHFARLHLQFSALQELLPVLLRKGSVKQLHLRFEADNHPKHYVYDASLPLSKEVAGITSVTIFGWPRQLTDCNTLMQQLGSTLLSLKFMEYSPPQVCAAVTRHCHRLQRLVIEGSSIIEDDLHQLVSPTLEDISLVHIHCLPRVELRLPQLQRCEIIAITSVLPRQEAETLRLILSLPASLKEIRLHVLRSQANATIAAIGNGRFPGLQTLSLHVVDPEQAANVDPVSSSATDHQPPPPVPDSQLAGEQQDQQHTEESGGVDTDPADHVVEVEEDGSNGPDGNSSHASTICIEPSAMETLVRHCPMIRVVEIMGSDVVWSVEAFRCLLRSGRFVRKVKAFITDDILFELPQLLSSAEMLQELVFYENATLLSDIGEWVALEEQLAAVSERFPSINIRLEDHWWEPNPL